jgi:hypothetical protein
MDPLTFSFLAWTTLAAASQTYITVEASFEAPLKAGADGAVAILLKPTAPKVVVNENPAPRLKLDAAQTILVDRQPQKAPAAPADPAQAKYLDPKVPVRFAVALAPGATKGAHNIKATVTYFYCSKAEGWCRKGTTDVTVEVSVP